MKRPAIRFETTLPQECAPFLEFAQVLRLHGFAVSPDQTEAFLAAVTLLGPGSMEHIRRAAIATLAPPFDRLGAFEALFRAVFYGDGKLTGQIDHSGEETVVNDRSGIEQQGETELQKEKGGAKASTLERLAAADLQPSDPDFRVFRRQLPESLPRRHAFRHERVKSNGAVDLRRSLREIVRADGDLPVPHLRRRRQIVRRLLLFIDISGSMSGHTDDLIALAYAAMQAAGNSEVFTIGTRLSRITTALRHRDRQTALARVAGAVDDWNGGTRIGPSLSAFLDIPRFAAMARGSVVLIASDALERGGHEDFERAMRRLSGLSFRLILATPLAGDPRFRPQTAALRAILPWLDDLIDGSSAEGIAKFMLRLQKEVTPPSVIFKENNHAPGFQAPGH